MSFVHARAVVALWIVIALACLAVTALWLKFDTDPGKMISSQLPFRQAFHRLTRAFPQLDNAFVVVVDGPDNASAREAARALALSFRARPELFSDVYAPGASRFYDDFGVLYLSRDQVARLAGDLERSAPLLSALAATPNLVGLSAVMKRVARGARRGLAPAGLDRFIDQLDAAARGAASDLPRPLDWARLGSADIEAKARTWYVLARPRLDFTAVNAAEAAMREAHAIITDPEISRSGHITVKLTGEAAVNAEEFDAVTQGAALAGMVSFVLVTLIVLVGMPAVRLTLPALALLVCGFAVNAGFATLAIGHLNMISVAFAVLFIGLGIDYAVHVVLRFHEAVGQSGDTRVAVVDAVTHAGPALGLCTLTTGLAFIAFTPTEFVGMAQLGIIAAAGIVIALAASLTLIPGVIALLPSLAERRRSRRERTAGVFLQPFVRLRPALAVVVMVGALAATSVLGQVRFDGDPINLKDPQAPGVVALRQLIQRSPQLVYAAQAMAPDENRARRLKNLLSTLDEVGQVRIASDFLPVDQDAKLALLRPVVKALPAQIAALPPLDDSARLQAISHLRRMLASIAATVDAPPRMAAAARRLAASLQRLETARQRADFEQAVFIKLPAVLTRLARFAILEPLRIDDLDAPTRERYIAADGRWRVEIAPRGDISSEARMRRFAAAVRRVVSDATGAPVEIIGAADVVSRAMVFASLLALALVVLALVAILRRVRDVVLVLAPIVLAAMLLLAYTVVFNAPFNFANVIVLPLLIGLGIDSAVHLVMRARENAHSDITATSTPRAVLLSSLTTIGSFGALWLSPHRGMASMGELLTFAIIFTLLTTLVVLPQLIAWLGNANSRH